MREPESSPFVEWVRVRLAVRRISIRQLAARAGVDASTVSRMLAGEREPALTTAIKIATVLRGPGDRLDAILDGDPANRNPVAVVRSALRSDPALRPAAIDELMAAYLAARDPGAAAPSRPGDDPSSGS